jgi:hypothetical protein
MGLQKTAMLSINAAFVYKLRNFLGEGWHDRLDKFSAPLLAKREILTYRDLQRSTLPRISNVSLIAHTEQFRARHKNTDQLETTRAAHRYKRSYSPLR